MNPLTSRKVNYLGNFHVRTIKILSRIPFSIIRKYVYGKALQKQENFL